MSRTARSQLLRRSVLPHHTFTMDHTTTTPTAGRPARPQFDHASDSGRAAAFTTGSGTLPHVRAPKRPDHFGAFGRRKDRPGDDIIRQRIKEARRPDELAPGASIADAVDLAGDAIGLNPEESRLFAIGAMARAVDEMGGWDSLDFSPCYVDEEHLDLDTILAPGDATDVATEYDVPLWPEVDVLPVCRPHRRSFANCLPEPPPRRAPVVDTRRKVVDLESGFVYASARDCARSLGVGKSSVARAAAVRGTPSKLRHQLWPVRLAYLDEVQIKRARGAA